MSLTCHTGKGNCQEIQVKKFITDSSNKSLRRLKNKLLREVTLPLHLLLLATAGSDLFCKSQDHFEVLEILGSEK